MELTEKSLNTLELPKVLTMLTEQAVSDRAKKQCMALRPADTLFECNKLQEQTEEAVKLIGLHGSPPFSGLKDISALLERAEKGGLLNPGELLTVAALLRSARLTRAYRQEKSDDSTLGIDEYFSRISGNKYLEDSITAAIVSEEEISDSASQELYQIRRQIRTASSKVRDVLNKIVTSQSYSKMLQDNIITQRNGRFVVPVKAEYRGSFGGLVHDMSSSGATLFVEPASVVELNNSIRVLMGKEQAEIEKILFSLSAQVAQFSGAIAQDYEILCELDVIFAKGKLAYKMKALRPKLDERGRTELIRARHPLLNKDTVVPVSFMIGGKCDTVIITGPNTGGKTVSIKTLGLLTLMAQCGLQIPASDESRVVIYRQVLADIGDEQSIEQSLSTFSSHMKNIVEILSVAEQGTLVLLDELGAGTDPVEGAALAVAIIEYLRAKRCTVAATTHYAELKVYALETDGVENASCEFDVQTLKPTYKLVFGVPGKSNAFAISRKIGLDESIIRAASENIGAQNKQFEDVVSKLEEKRQQLERQLEESERKLREAESARTEARGKLDAVNSEREKLIEAARRQASEIIGAAREAGDRAIEEAKRIRKEAQDGQEQNLNAARAKLRGELSEAAAKVAAQELKREARPLPRPLKEGDDVEIVATRTRGTVLKTGGKDGSVLVQAGILKINVAVEELELIESDKPKPAAEKPSVSAPSAPSARGVELDVRGENGDDAILEVDRFIDDAVRLRLETVTIIHGKGTGVLRQRIRTHLRRHSQVKAFRPGVYGEGEDGVTVVTLAR